MSLKKGEIYEFEDFRLDVSERFLLKRGKRIQLTDKAFDVLSILVGESGRLVTKDELLISVWPNTFVEENNLDKNVSRIRRALGEKKGRQKFIETVRGRGYRFVADVQRVEEANDNGVPDRVPAPMPARPKADPSVVSEKNETKRARTVVALADWRNGQEVVEYQPTVVDAEQIETHERQNKSSFRLVLVLVAAVLIVAFGLVGFNKLRTPVATTNAPVESLAVLPFTNESGNAELDYLSEGLSENLIDKLAQVSGLKVIARSSSFKYRGSAVDIADAASKLGVHAIVTGRVVQRGDDLLIRVEMVDTRDNRQLWSEQYSRKPSDVFAIQDEIARTASEKLRLRLSGADAQRLAKNYTDNAEAYQLYLRGHFLQYKTNAQDLFRSIEYFQQAIALDPNFALAYVGLSESTGRLDNYLDVPRQNYKQMAREYVLKALSLDDQLPEAHATWAGFLWMGEYDFAGAEREYLGAIELNPNYSEAHRWRGQLLSSLGRHDEALAEIKRSIELDPLSLEANSMYGEALYYGRRYDESTEHMKKVLYLDPNYFPARRILAFNYEIKGDYAARVAEAVEMNERVGRQQYAEAMRKSFEKGGWRGFLRDAAENKFNLHSYLIATFWAQLGEKEKALSTLEKLYEERHSSLVLINVDPRLDNLRGEPRFQNLLAKVGFGQ